MGMIRLHSVHFIHSLRKSKQSWLHTAISRKVVGKNVHATISKGNMGYDQYAVPDNVAVKHRFVAFLWHLQTYVHGLSCHSFKFLWRTVNSKPLTIPFGLVACTFSDNLSRNSCICCTCTIATWRLRLQAPLVACYDNFEFWRQKLHVASKPDKSSSSSERGSCISVNKCSSAYLLK